MRKLVHVILLVAVIMTCSVAGGFAANYLGSQEPIPFELTTVKTEIHYDTDVNIGYTDEKSEGAIVTINPDGTVLIEPKDGYIIVDVIVNGESQGRVDKLTGIKRGDKIEVYAVTEKEFEATLNNYKLWARSNMSSAKGKRAVKVRWFASDGHDFIYNLDFDGYEVYRSKFRYFGYGRTPIFTTTRQAYWNTAIESGNKYYYKVRGYMEIGDKTYYTSWSRKAWRTVRPIKGIKA